MAGRRIVRQTGIRNRQKSQTGRDPRAGRIVRQAGVDNEQAGRQTRARQQAGSQAGRGSVAGGLLGRKREGYQGETG